MAQPGRTMGGGEIGSEATVEHLLLSTQAPVDQGDQNCTVQTGGPLWLEEPNQWVRMFLSL